MEQTENPKEIPFVPSFPFVRILYSTWHSANHSQTWGYRSLGRAVFFVFL
jgi:hypothetical protein